MTPQDVAVLTALAAMLQQIGTWPILSVLVFVMIGPWIAMFLLSRNMDKRHSAVVQMYESNVQLVKNYEKIADGLQDILVLSTQAMTGVKTSVDNNLYCPLMRKDPKTVRES